MFERLFAESGLSLDRLRTLLEVAAAGSIVKAAAADPVRQSQFSRQVKELEDFFQTKLIERQGKGTRLTVQGRELARISRFFLMGLSNFQRGSLSQEQTFRIGASATYIASFLLPTLAHPRLRRRGTRYAIEVVADQEIERRLHDLTLDYGVVVMTALSRPLQVHPIGTCRLELWASKGIRLSSAGAAQAFRKQTLPLVLPVKELASFDLAGLAGYEPYFECDSFLDAQTVLAAHPVAALLPSFLTRTPEFGRLAKVCFRVPVPEVDTHSYTLHLAWNPRLVRLNPHAGRWRDLLSAELSRRVAR